MTPIDPTDKPAASRPGRPVLAVIPAIGAWIGTGAGLAFFAWVYDGPFGLFEFLARWTWMAVGLAAVITSLIVVRDRARRRAALATAALVSIVLAASPFLWPIARDLGWRCRVRATLFLNRGRYEAIAARVAKGAGRRGERDGIRYVVDAGPPVRVAFPIGEGILDNWTAIVRDPSGELGGLKGRGDRLRLLFGGEIAYVRDLGGGYFYCVFT